MADELKDSIFLPELIDLCIVDSGNHHVITHSASFLKFMFQQIVKIICYVGYWSWDQREFIVKCDEDEYFTGGRIW